MTIRLATINQNGASLPAIGNNKMFWPLADLSAQLGVDNFPGDMIGLFESWSELRPRFDELLQSANSDANGQGIPVAEADFGAPIQFPGKVLCAGANYYDHLTEMGVKDTSKENQRLFFFFKPPRNAVVGPGRTAFIPPRCRQYDWEIELAVVFGKTIRNASLENSLDGIAAVTVAIDLSARDLNSAPETFYKLDWVAGKANDTACPMGPWLIPADQIGDLQDLSLKLSVNGEIKQDACTSGMIFSIAEQIVIASSIMTLDPGDVMLTGTPAGVGKPKGTFLKPGDLIGAEIGNVGKLDVEICG